MIRRAVLPLLLLALGLVAGVLVARIPPDYERTVVTRRHHGSDPLLTAALLRFDVESLLHHPSGYFQPPFLYPDRNPQRGTEPLIAEALLAVPFRLVLGDRPAPLFTWVRIVTLALVALATGLMLRELGASPSMALLGGGLSVLVATTAVFFDRLQAVSLQWLPFAILFGARYWRGGRAWNAVAFGASVFLTVQASLYTTVMLLTVVPFLAPLAWTQRRVPGVWRRGATLALSAAAAAGLSVLVLSPYLHARADVAAYSSPAFAAEKSWGAATLQNPARSPPEWPLGPPSDWDGVFPGFAFLLLVGAATALALADAVRRRGASASTGEGDAHGTSRWILGLALGGLLATVTWAAWAGSSDGVRLAAGVLLWGSMLWWCLRLARWPSTSSDEDRLRLLVSAASLAAFVLFVVSLGSPVRVTPNGEPLLQGGFAPLSHVLTPLREMRELKRFLLPAGWAAVVAATLALELHLRGRPRWLAPLLATTVLAVGLGERLRADTTKVFAPPVPETYALLQESSGTGGLLELPFDHWGRIKSVHRMLWQPSHGRPIVAGKTGIDPGWYTPARDVFNEFPAEESLLLMDAWGLDTVLDHRSRPGDPVPALPEGLVLRGREVGANERWEWRLFDLVPGLARPTLGPEPPAGPGTWQTPSPPSGDDAAARATDGSPDTAAEVVDQEGLLLTLPEGVAAAVEIDYGAGRFSRVPPQLRVLGFVDGEWQDLTDEGSGTFLRARAAHQLLRRQSARLVVTLRPSEARQLRLVSTGVPWDAPEVRVRVAPAS